MKSTIENVVMATDDDIIIIDAEREYGDLARALLGTVIEISPTAPTTSTLWSWETATRTGRAPLPSSPN